jgi:tetratricopeptide (TPR) repeat protein
MKQGLILILATLSLVLTGCGASRSFVSFEILEPAEITYPQDVRKIGYLNRAPITKNSFARMNRRHLDPVSLKILDTMVCNNLKQGFLDARENSGLEYLEDIRELESRRRDTSNKFSLMGTRFRENIFRDYSLDALVVLEFYEVLVTQSFAHYDPYLGEFVQEIMVSSRLLWRVYAEDMEKPVDEHLAHDTVYFLNRAGKELKERFNASKSLASGAYEFGYQYGERHIPEWKGVSRIIFRGGAEELVMASKHTDAGEWDQALYLWESLIEYSDDEKDKARAYNNMAVYYELEDNLDRAEACLDLAVKYWDHQSITDYKAALDKRLINREDILKQYRVEE